ncbi:hypothetical protein ACH6CV_12260 [Bacillota bacterium Meth-B3]
MADNSKLHFSVFLDGQIHGAMSYGPSLDKSKTIGLVEGTGWNEFPELHRMAFDAVLPRNSESRAISMIKVNPNLAELPDGTRIRKMALASNPTTPRRELNGLTFFDVTGGACNFKKYLNHVSAKPIPGLQLRYMYFIDPAYREKLTVPIIPFTKIDEWGAGIRGAATVHSVKLFADGKPAPALDSRLEDDRQAPFGGRSKQP